MKKRHYTISRDGVLDPERFNTKAAARAFIIAQLALYPQVSFTLQEWIMEAEEVLQ